MYREKKVEPREGKEILPARVASPVDDTGLKKKRKKAVEDYEPKDDEDDPHVIEANKELAKAKKAMEKAMAAQTIAKKKKEMEIKR